MKLLCFFLLFSLSYQNPIIPGKVVEGEFAAIKPVEDKHYLDFINVPENEEDVEEVPDELLVVDYADKNIDPETESFDPGPEDIFEKLNPKLDELAPIKEDILPEEEEETEDQKKDFGEEIPFDETYEEEHIPVTREEFIGDENEEGHIVPEDNSINLDEEPTDEPEPEPEPKEEVKEEEDGNFKFEETEDLPLESAEGNLEFPEMDEDMIENEDILRKYDSEGMELEPRADPSDPDYIDEEDAHTGYVDSDAFDEEADIEWGDPNAQIPPPDFDPEDKFTELTYTEENDERENEDPMEPNEEKVKKNNKKVVEVNGEESDNFENHRGPTEIPEGVTQKFITEFEDKETDSPLEGNLKGKKGQVEGKESVEKPTQSKDE